MKLPPWLWRVFASRRLRIALICSPFILMIGLVAFYAFMNWWGPRQFERTLANLKAEGFPTTAEEVYGSLPDDQDALKHPALIAVVTGDKAVRLRSLKGASMSGFATDDQLGECSPTLAVRSDVTQWADPPRPGESEAEVARHLLFLITAYSARFDSMSEAFKRPHARWTEGNDFNAPSRFTPLYFAPRFVGDRAILKLVSGDPDGAASDVVALSDLLNLLSRKNQMMGCLMAMGGEPKLSEVIWEGIHRGVWTDPHLRNFQSTLDQLDFQKAAVTSADLAMTAMISQMRQSPKYLDDLKDSKDWGELGESFVNESLEGDRGALSDIFRESWLKARPVGCDYLALIDHIHLVRAGRERVGVPPRTAFTPRIVEKFRAASGEAKGFEEVTYQMLALFGKRAIHVETRINLLRCGIALERYRLKYGTTPEKLEAVVPEFLAAIPLDVCDQQPLRSQRLPDGSPHVWSLWPSGKDEGGMPKQGNEKGNAVWTTGAIPGLTEAVYRR